MPQNLPENSAAFLKSLESAAPDPAWPDGLRALWFDARGDWEASHDIAQEIPGTEGSRLHAYLHRKEGDRWNAEYWYGRAGTAFPGHSLEVEFETLLARYLRR